MTSALDFPRSSHGLSRIATPGRCIAASLLLWPAVGITTDIVGFFPERWFGIEDFGLAAMDVTWPTSCIIAIGLWFYGFWLSSLRPRWLSMLLAIMTLPAWGIPTIVVTFLMFPFGRISDTF